ncbi:MAG: hypothetical protein ABIZ70_11100 [Gemmatimonadales bacterium]
MKLIDQSETVIVVIAAELEEEAPDRGAAARLQAEVNRRGAGHPYRRAVVVSDFAWQETDLFHLAPTIAVGGPGVNSVSGRLGSEIPTVWTLDDRIIIQADYIHGAPRATLWGMDAAATTAAVETFIARGWLDEFLDRCWRFRAGAFA